MIFIIFGSIIFFKILLAQEIIQLKTQICRDQNIRLLNGSSFTLEWKYLISKDPVHYTEIHILEDNNIILSAKKKAELSFKRSECNFSKYIETYEDDKIILKHLNSNFHGKKLQLSIEYKNESNGLFHHYKKTIGTFCIKSAHNLIKFRPYANPIALFVLIVLSICYYFEK
ncbi:hypothetical protein MXB_3024 [Myxobolus squamalis]|nr:hypothetical protein MXB_3024 [Myxobolus squamalis]